MNQDQQSELITLLSKYTGENQIIDTAIPGLRYYNMPERSTTMPVVYRSSFCLIVQGKKQVMLGEEIHSYAAGEFLAVSVDLPVTGQVIEATLEKPYLSIQLDIDQLLLRELMMQLEIKSLHGDKAASGCNTDDSLGNDMECCMESNAERGLFVGKADRDLADCVLRLVRLLETPRDIPFISPMIIRELYYRLLHGEQSRRIAQIVMNGSNMQRISQVIQMLKTNFTKQIRVEDMAEVANMSTSSFHHHFKEVTAMSPLQYQKRLRLMEARRLMMIEEKDATTAAYHVGYGSTSQFSREYSRMFGAPPISDIMHLREAQEIIEAPFADRASA